MKKLVALPMLFLSMLAACSENDGATSETAKQVRDVVLVESESSQQPLSRVDEVKFARDSEGYASIGSLISEFANAFRTDAASPSPFCSPYEIERIRPEQALHAVERLGRLSNSEADFEAIHDLMSSIDRYSNKVVAFDASTSLDGVGMEHVLHIAFRKDVPLPDSLAGSGNKFSFSYRPIGPNDPDGPLGPIDPLDPIPLDPHNGFHLCLLCMGGDNPVCCEQGVFCSCVYILSPEPCSESPMKRKRNRFQNFPDKCWQIDCCGGPGVPPAWGSSGARSICDSLLDRCGEEGAAVGCRSQVPVTELPFGKIPQELLESMVY